MFFGSLLDEVGVNNECSRHTLMAFDIHKQGKIVEWVQKDADGIAKCRL